MAMSRPPAPPPGAPPPPSGFGGFQANPADPCGLEANLTDSTASGPAVFSAWDRIYMVVLGSLIVATLLGLPRFSSPVLGWIKARRAALRTTRASTWLCPHDDEVESLVSAQLLDLRVSQFRGVAGMLCFVLASSSLSRIHLLLNSETTGPQDKLDDSLALLIQGTFTLLFVVPRLINTRSIGFIYAAILLMCTARVKPWGPMDRSGAAVMEGTLVVLTLNVVVPSMRGATHALSVAYGLCTGYALSQIHPTSPFMASSGQIVATTLSTCAAYWLEQTMRRTLHCSQQVQAVKELYSAACAILRSCCEVVVELDSEGVVLDSGTDLSSFLLRGTYHDCQGLRLADLIADEEERNVFLQRLSAPKMKNVGLAENLPVSMKDACGNTLRLELLWFQFQKLGGSAGYMVGLREFSDEMVHPSQQRVAVPGVAEEHPLPNDSVSLPETSSVNTGLLEQGGAVVAVDGTAEGLTVRALSSEFCMRVGRLPVGTPLANYVSQAREFVAWVQYAANQYFDGIRPQDYHVTLKMPQGKMKTICRLLPRSGWGADPPGRDDTNCALLHLLFYNIRLKHEPRASTVRRPSLHRGTPPACGPLASVSL